MNCVWKLGCSAFICVAFCPSVSLDRATAAPVQEEALKKEMVGCAIKGDPTCVSGIAPKITVALTNLTDTDIYLVGNLDGSESKDRYPHCYFEITDPDGKPVLPKGRVCNSTTRLEARHFVKLQAGQSFDPYQKNNDYSFFESRQLEAANFRRPGVYRIRFVYSTKSDDIVKWHADRGRGRGAAREVKKLFDLVPKIEVRSNEFELTVIRPGWPR